jgi:hypothetical protein
MNTKEFPNTEYFSKLFCKFSESLFKNKHITIGQKDELLTFSSPSEPPAKALQNYARPTFLALVVQELSEFY